MKKMLWIVLAIVTFFMFNNDVFAYVDSKNAEIECIYGNGVVAGLSYDTSSQTLSAYIKEYPVSETSVIDGDPITNISFFNVDHAITRLKDLACPSSIRYWKAWEYTNEEKTDKSYRGVYSFDWCSNKASGCNTDDRNAGITITNALKKSQKTGWFIFSGDEEIGGTDLVTGTNLIQQAQPEAEIPLVGERIYLVGDIGDNAYFHTYKLADDSGQAVGTTKYAQVYLGSSTYSGSTSIKRFLHVGNVITSISLSGSSVFSSEYICIKESITTQDSSRGDSSYKFSSIRHEVKKSAKDSTCPDGYKKYVRTTDTCSTTAAENKDSFCDKYPNVAFVLIDVVKVMQILVPAIVIIFTGIEIGRIVVAGNIEEELPKRKKNIVIRFIVMLAFFFLPLIIQLIISLVDGVSILDVSCLFNDGKKVESNSELNCVSDTDTNTE